MRPGTARELPPIEGLRAALIPSAEGDPWDRGELPQAVLNLGSQIVLARCDVLLRLAVVRRRALDRTETASIVALREVVRDLLPKNLDHPMCDVLRALAGLAEGTAGRRRGKRQEVAGRLLGEGPYVVHPRSVRRRVRNQGWPWLFDRLIEREIQERKAIEAERREHLEAVYGSSRGTIAASPTPAASPAPPEGGFSGSPLAISGLLAPIPLESASMIDCSAAGCPGWWYTAFTGPGDGAGQNTGPSDGAGQGLWRPEPCPVLPAFTGDARLDADMRRRAFLVGIPVAWSVARAGFTRSRAWAETARLDEAGLDGLASAIAAEKRLHDQLGTRAVYGLATENVRLAMELLPGSPAALRPRLAALAAEAAAEVGYVCHDQRERSDAQSYYQLATELAQEAGDPRLEAFVLGNWADRLLGLGEADRALPVLDRANRLVLWRASPATLRHLAMVESNVQARLGDVDASLRALDRIDNAPDRSADVEDTSLLYWLHDGILAGSRARCFVDIGRLEEADVLLDHALSHWDSSFVCDRTTFLVDLATVRLRQAELDESCRLASEALELAVSTRSPRAVQRVRDLRLELQPWHESTPVRALDDRMAAASWM